MGCAHVWMMSVGVVEQRFVERFVLTTVLQRTMIGSEDKVANNPLTMNIVVSSIILTKDYKEIS